jgi:PAS domain S-box-containing protein
MILGVMIGNMTLAIRTGLECLEMFGIEVPEHPTPEQMQVEYDDLRRILGDRPIASLIDLPMMNDTEMRAATDILIELAISSYHVNHNLFVMVLCRVVKLGMQHGISGSIVTAFAGLAFVLGPLFHRFDDGERFAELAVAVADRHGLTAQKASVHFAAQMAFCWTRPLDDAVAHLDIACQAARETGEIVYACYAVEHRLTDLLARGDSLDQIWQQTVSALDFVQTKNVRHVVDIVLSTQAFVQSLRERCDDASVDHAILDARVLGDGVPVASCFLWIRHMQRHFLLGDPETALEHAENAKPILWSARCHIQSVDYCVYQSLALAAVFPTAPPKRQIEARATLVANLEALQRWAESCPATFSHKHTLVAAEMARLDGRDMEAMQRYEQAIQRSADYGFIQDQALGNELAARFYFSRSLSKVAFVYLRDARDCYARWGALAKVEQLEESHPDLRRPAASPLLTTIEAPAEELDLGIVVKTSEALSGEIVLDKLIHTLMSIAVEHAGAARGLLLLPRDGEFRVEAEATTEADTVTVRVHSAAATSGLLPESILRYVVRTHESVILGDASTDDQVATDPYIQRKNARSILCLPLVKQANLIGVLYLENDLAPHVFTAARIALLKLLASQAAISLENARLYTDLQRSEAYLVQGQELSRTGTWAFDLSTGAIEWSEQIFRMFGRDPGRKVTLSDVLGYVHPDDRVDVESVIGRIRAGGGKSDYIFRIVREDGQMLFLRNVSTPVYDDGVVTRYFGTAMDVTERKKAEEDVREAQATLAHVARVMTMGELASSIAHEVNQPLAAVVTSGNAAQRWLAAEPPNIDEAQECARRIVRDGKRAADVIARIRMLAQRSTPVKAPVDLNDTIEEVLAMINVETRQHQVAIRTELAAGLPQVLADRVQVQQVVLNLTMNALDAMKGITERRRELFIRSDVDPAGVCVAVQDTGIGLDPQSMERLFQAFYTTKASGMGMGLAISRTIIEAHGGRLWATSNHDGGATFQFTLPTTRKSGV